MKAAISKMMTWFKNHLPTKRRLIQVYAALLFNANLKGYVSGRIFTGKTKYACVPGLNCYSCPGAVGSCPLGALQNALATGDKSGLYYMFGILALFGIIFGRTICGYLCPVGLGQELLYKIRTPKLKKSKFTRVLSYLKYVLLVGFVIIIPVMYGVGGIPVPAFCKYICPAGTFGGGLGLLLNPANQDYLDMLGPIFTWKFSLMCVIIVACIFIYRAFCRFICPLGALYGFFNRFCFVGVKVDKENCTECGLCVSHCKMDIRHVGDHECINCGECISVCPTKAISYKGGKLVLRKNEVADIDQTPVEAPVEAQTKLSTRIDGFTEPSLVADGATPMGADVTLLKGARITLPTFMPDTGLPSGTASDAPASNGSELPSTANENAANEPDKTGDVSDEESNTATQNETTSNDTTSSDKKDDSSAIDGEKSLNGSNGDGSDSGDNSVLDGDTTASRAPAANGDKEPSKSGGNGSARRKKRPASFWVQIVASALAIVVLVGALVYFNVDWGGEKERVYDPPEIGEKAPDFSLHLYERSPSGLYVQSEDMFTLSEQTGKITVVNFWGTWCGPCIAEIPDFIECKKNYPEINVIAVHGATNSATGEVNEIEVSTCIIGHSWDTITFAQDILDGKDCVTFRTLGGKDSWPLTVIIDGNGIVRFIRHGKLGYETLSEQVEALLAEQA